MISSISTKIIEPGHFVDVAQMSNTTLKTPCYDHVVHDLDMVMPTRGQWAEYERQKRHIAEWSRSPAEYENK